jgi:hypothetical protein
MSVWRCCHPLEVIRFYFKGVSGLLERLFIDFLKGCCGSPGTETVRDSLPSIMNSEGDISGRSFVSSVVPYSMSSSSESWFPLESRPLLPRAQTVRAYPSNHQQSYFSSGFDSAPISHQPIMFNMPQSFGWSSVMPNHLMSTFTNSRSFGTEISGCRNRPRFCPQGLNCYTPTATMRCKRTFEYNTKYEWFYISAKLLGIRVQPFGCAQLDATSAVGQDCLLSAPLLDHLVPIATNWINPKTLMNQFDNFMS